jgi:hypothetical protein
MSTKWRQKPCYWCGGYSTGRDHVFPLALFEEPPPANLITVPACEAHNKHLELDEGYFRVLAVGPAYKTEAGRAMWDDRVLRQFERAPGLRRRLASQLRTQDLDSSGGIYLGSVPALQGQPDRINRVLEKMVRGLYYDKHREILGNVQFSFFPFNPLFTDGLSPELKEIVGGMPPPRFLGESVMFRFGSAVEDKRAAFWVLIFFKRTFFVVSTTPPELLHARTPTDGNAEGISADVTLP